MAKITVIGSFVMDIVAHVNEFPVDGQTILGNSIATYPGGKGANQAVAMARLGAEVQMIGMLGKDLNGSAFREIMAAEGINYDYVFLCDKPTAVAQVQINAKSENKIVVVPSANHCFTSSHLASAEKAIVGSDMAVLQLELPLKVTEECIKLCVKHKVPVILNPAPAAKIDCSALRLVDYLTPNESELEVLSGVKILSEHDLHQAMDVLLDLGVKNIIATLGSKGAMIANKTGKEVVGGYKVTAVDTVAAGDSFNGALARCLVSGLSLRESVQFANAVGAITVTRHGAIPSLPTLDEVQQFILNYS